MDIMTCSITTNPAVYILVKVSTPHISVRFANGCSVLHKNTITEDCLSLSAMLLREAWAVIMEIGGRILR